MIGTMHRTSMRQSCPRMRVRFPSLTRGFYNATRMRRSEATPCDRGSSQSASVPQNLIVHHPVTMLDDRSEEREESSMLQVDGILIEEDQALLNWSSWNSDHKAPAELSVAATMLFSEDYSIPINCIYEAFLEKHFCIFEAPIGSGFVTTSMSMFIIGAENDSYEFEFAYMPLNSSCAAFFTTAASLEPLRRLHFSHAKLMNHLLLLNCKHWDVPLSKGDNPLEHTVRDWTKATSN